MKKDISLKKREMLIILGFMYIIFVSLITPLFVKAAFVERGYFAVGGEYMPLIMIPFVIGGIYELLKK